MKKSSRSAVKEKKSNNENPFEIITANSGEQAIRIVQDLNDQGKSVAGGFFDVKMEPGIDGIQTIQEIWKIDPHVHCTIVTAYQDRNVEDIDTLFGARFKDQWDYLSKPFLQGEIVQKARQMMASWNRKRGLEVAIEELKAAQKVLIQSEKLAAIGQVARGMAHEFGNILQRIVGKTDLSLSESDPKKIQENLELILKAADRASIIIRNLQSFSKISAKPTRVDLYQAAETVLSLVNQDLKKASVEFVDARNKNCIVTANMQEVEQVLLNLVLNAIHAMEKGGKLEVGCQTTDENVILWVKDSGIGISDDVLPHIFDFAFTTKEKGSGLGLSISKRLIENSHGKLSVETKLGEGSKFLIEFAKERT